MTPSGASLPIMGSHFSAFLDNRRNLLPGSQCYESARAALYALLLQLKPRNVFSPNYICRAIPDVVRASGAHCVRYAIGEGFRLADDFQLGSGDLVILVDYFGLTRASISEQLLKFPASNVILDCSQSYFFPNVACLAAISSPRKFLPVADGGCIRTAISLSTENPDDIASITRYQYLLHRVVSEPAQHRSLYLEAERQLEDVSVRAMSGFTRKILETLDIDFVIERRRQNFAILEGLADINRLPLSLGDQVPLCYPLMVDNADALREFLMRMKIYTPRYWPDVKPANKFEWALLNETVYLPVDHRYGVNQMMRLADLVRSFI